MDIKEQLEELKQRLSQQFETETPERTAAREKALKKLLAAMTEFDSLSQKVGTTPDQMAVITQLQSIINKLGDLQGPEK